MTPNPDPQPMTPRLLEILQHALGVDEYGRTPKGFTPYTRNHFCAGEGDEPDCRELVALGFMVEHAKTEWLPYFNCSVTDMGKKAMHAASPSAPKLTRSQKRYRAFLDADCDMTFFEYMKLNREAAHE
jgi:hypothetical protein